MTYQETIDYLFAQLPMFSRIGAAAYKEDLDNTIALCKEVGNPHTTFKSIHIAGTNGKGSTSHMLAAILQQAGYKTGLYTSPHLKDFRERIKINGAMITEDFVIDFVQRTKKISEEIHPSFFELTVVMAFDYFAQEKVDFAIIETGLGGRLDSTNIITPILSVITNIGYDHMNILGDTLEKIAAEKAGIIKKDIPVVIGEYLPETKDIFIDKAYKEHAPLYFAQEEYAIGDVRSTTKELRIELKNIDNHQRANFVLDLNGLYQRKNLRTVICAINILQKNGVAIKEECIHSALSNVKKLTGLHGRWDVIHENPTVVLDVAHNEDGIQQVLMQVEQIAASNMQSAKVHFVIGMVKDKEVSKVLSLLPSDALYYFTNAHIPRAMSAIELQEKAKAYNLLGNCFDEVNDAIAAAKANATAADLIIVCGSVFLVGEVNV